MPRQNKVLLYERVGDALLVTPTGDSLRIEEREFGQEIDRLHQLLDSPEITGVVIDVSGSPYMGSLILGSIITLCKRVTDRGGKAALCNASEGMRESLQIMRIDSIIPYLPTREEALAAVS